MKKEKTPQQPKYPVAGITDLRQILEKQEFKCALTGDALEPSNTAFDHVLPLSKGGTSLKENLQAVLKKANQSKCDLTMEEYTELCFKVLRIHGAKYGYEVKKIIST